MRFLRAFLAAAIALPAFFVLQRAMSWTMSPPAPKVVRAPPNRIQPLPANLDGLLQKGRALSPAKITELRRRVEVAPGDAPARAMLLATSFMTHDGSDNVRIHNEQTVWFVANMPDSPLLSEGEVNVDNVLNARTYELLLRLYDEALAKRPTSVPILLNLAALNLTNDTPGAIAALERAARLAPKDGQVFSRLAFAHTLASHRIFGGADKNEASLAVESYLKARALGSEVSDKYFLQAAFDSGRFDVVRREAGQRLKERDDPDAVYAAHTQLGRVALREGDVAGAKRHLLASADVSGSPVLGSFGPDMDLAKELLAKGERDAVLTYLKATGRFWKDERQVRWTKAFADGGTPDWD